MMHVGELHSLGRLRQDWAGAGAQQAGGLLGHDAAGCSGGRERKFGGG